MHESTVHLTPDEITLLVEALDSHEYWQLSESHERNDGYSTAEDGASEEIDAVRALISKLERAPRLPTSSYAPVWIARAHADANTPQRTVLDARATPARRRRWYRVRTPLPPSAAALVSGRARSEPMARRAG